MIKKDREVVINKCYGGFGLSHQGVMEYAKMSGFELYPFVDKRDKNRNLLGIGKEAKFESYNPKKDAFTIYYSKKPLENGQYVKDSWFYDGDLERDDPILVKVVRKLKEKSFGECANLKIVRIPADVEYEIEEYDGTEWIAESHKTWG